jgi:hypothetical protein
MCRDMNTSLKLPGSKNGGKECLHIIMGSIFNTNEGWYI